MESIIEQDNEIIDEQENPTIDHSPTSDEVILEEPNIECHEHLVCCSPNNSTTMDDIMVSGESSLGDDDKVMLEFPSLREVNKIQPQHILYPPSHKQKQKKPKYTLQHLKTYVFHTYNT
jgi:hypothetical protein